MIATESFNILTLCLIFAGWPVITTFILLYAIRSPWQSTIAGRAIMNLALALWALYALSAANSLFGQDWPFRGLGRTIVFLVILAALIRMVVTLLRIQALEPIGPARPPESQRGVRKEDDTIDDGYRERPGQGS